MILTVALELQHLCRCFVAFLDTHFPLKRSHEAPFELFKQNFNSLGIFCAGTQLQDGTASSGKLLLKLRKTACLNFGVREMVLI